MRFLQGFHRLSSRQKEEDDAMAETVKTLIDARIDRLESNFQNLRTEWADCYEKMMLLFDRNRKRIKVLQKLSDGEDPPEPAETPELTRDSVLRTYLSQNGL